MKRTISDWVQAHDGRTGWYDAKIVDERGKDESREVRIHSLQRLEAHSR